MNKKTLTPIFLTVIFGLTISYIAYAWSEPSQSMPSSEADPPINTGSDTQTKDGTLKINNGGGSVLILVRGGDIELFNSNNSGSASLFCDNNDQLSTNGTINAQDGLCIGGDCKSSWEEVGSGSSGSSGESLWQANGNNIYYNSGNVGIGTTNPTSLLDVNGNLRVNGKLTVSTIDPEYEIDGETYATYGIDFAGGVRNETSDNIYVDDYYTIDFENLEKESDIWLFWETSNKSTEDVVVILTPGFNGKAWYEKDIENNTITIYSDKKGEVSYRLTIPRQDDDNWPNKVK